MSWLKERRARKEAEAELRRQAEAKEQEEMKLRWKNNMKLKNPHPFDYSDEGVLTYDEMLEAVRAGRIVQGWDPEGPHKYWYVDFQFRMCDGMLMCRDTVSPHLEWDAVQYCRVEPWVTRFKYKVVEVDG